MARAKIVGTVELGTGKVAAVIARVSAGQEPTILGWAQQSSEGVTKGAIVDFTALSHVAHAVLSVAEKAAGETIEEVYLAQTGGHLSGFFNTATVNVTAANGVVSVADIERAQAEAKGKQLGPDRIYLHHIHGGFELDGRWILQAGGLEGHRLSVDYWSIHADTRHVRDAIHVINGYGLTVQDVIASSLASGLCVSSQAERQGGVLVIDIGAGTTDFALYERGSAKRTGCVAVGGDHITNDLSLGLRIPYANAKRLKETFAKGLLEPSDENEKVWLIGDQSLGDRSVSRIAMIQIVQARMTELFEVVLKMLEKDGPLPQLAAGVVLTGGGSQLLSCSELAEQVLGYPARLGTPLSERVPAQLRTPQWSTALGLLEYALLDEATQKGSAANRLSMKKLLTPAMSWLGFN